ncbi:Ger(x)C family spore germination protein [Metabacillus dongyingensis]|uniref:Ger(x)C family spore germination protein n=1 Tax=Metabacillus dongyingensis TaxID=2874282 RepID=UPI003B8B1F34
MEKYMIVVICIGVLLSGCSNYTESNEIGLVTGMGIDYDKESDLYEVTLQMINPSGVAGTSQGGGGLSVYQIEGKGKTISEAARNSSKKISRTNIYSHLTAVVISEELAREKGINFILDAFERDARIRPSVPLIVAREQSAKIMLSILPSLDKIPSVSFVKKINDTASVLGENAEITIFSTLSALSSKGQEPVINGMRIVGNIEQGASKANEEKVENTYVMVDGLAVFQKGYLVNWLDGQKAKSIQMLRNEMKNSNISISCPKKEGNVSIQIRRIKRNTNVVYEKGHVKIKVELVGAGTLNEMLCDIEFNKQEVLNQLEKKLNHKIKKDVLEGIHFAQNEKSDIFGFGEMLHRKNPNKWKKVENNWNEHFAAADVEIKVKMNIFGLGMRNKTYPF